MSHTYAQNVIHVVFSTKDRSKVIPREMQPRMWAYTSAICLKLGILVHAVVGMEDHAHFLIQVPPSLAVAKVVLTIKSNSSKWVNQQGCKFALQQGYGAFSVSSSMVPTVVRYIQNQKAHHRKMSFDAEFLALLKKHSIAFEPKFFLG